MAAREQGKFWEMHDKMFANQQALDRPSLEKYAQELGLNVAKFKAAMDDPQDQGADRGGQEAGGPVRRHRHADLLRQRTQDGRAPSPSTPSRAVIDEEIKKADDKLKAGVARAGLYDALTKDGLDKAAAPPPPGRARPARTGLQGRHQGRAQQGRQGRPGHHRRVLRLPVPLLRAGRADAAKEIEEYKGKVRIVWRTSPCPSTRTPRPPPSWPGSPTSRASSGRCTTSCSRTSASSTAPASRSTPRSWASTWRKVKAALDEKKYESQIKADLEMGQKIGVRGTPAFFINGTFLSGAQPFEAFKARIDQELAKAEALVKKGVARGKVYDAIMKNAQAAVAAAPPPPRPGGAAEPTPETDQTVFKVAAGNSPSRGPKNAPITVVLFSDFQCPFCSKVEPSITQLEKDFPGKIRVVWKDFPLGFHQNARPAAIAARAAGDEGKFWQMHSKLFENQRALDRPSLEKYAEELGLDLTKFRAALDSGKYSGEIDADMRSRADAGRAGDAGGLHQRPQDLGRLPLRHLQEGGRAGAGQDAQEVVMNRRRLTVLVIVVPAVAFLAVRFIHAAGNRARAMRSRGLPGPQPAEDGGRQGEARRRGAGLLRSRTPAASPGRLRALRGRPVLLNFWATWCPPCVEEMPSLENLSRRVGDRPHGGHRQPRRGLGDGEEVLSPGHRAVDPARQRTRRSPSATGPRSTRRPSSSTRPVGCSSSFTRPSGTAPRPPSAWRT